LITSGTQAPRQDKAAHEAARLMTLMDLWAQRQSILAPAKRRSGSRRSREGQLAMF
jgi:hypothetical protein